MTVPDAYNSQTSIPAGRNQRVTGGKFGLDPCFPPGSTFVRRSFAVIRVPLSYEACTVGGCEGRSGLSENCTTGPRSVTRQGALGVVEQPRRLAGSMQACLKMRVSALATFGHWEVYQLHTVEDFRRLTALI